MKCVIYFILFLTSINVVAQNNENIWVIKPQFDYAEPFSEGYALVGWKRNNNEMHYGFIDEKGGVLVGRHNDYFIEAKRFSNGLAPAKRTYGWGYINNYGGYKLGLYPKYEYASIFYEGMALVRLDNKEYILNEDGEQIYSTKDKLFSTLKNAILNHQSFCVEKTNEIIPFKYEGKWGYIPSSKTNYINIRMKPWSEYLSLQLNKLETYENFLKTCIEKEINEWQQKGEFEPTLKWKERVNELTRKQKISELTIKYRKVYESKLVEYNKRYKDLAEEYKKEYNKNQYDYYTSLSFLKINEFKETFFELMPYDADNQSFMIKSDKQGDILISVPLEEASSFKKNWDTIKNTITPTFVPSGDDMVLTSVTVANGNKKYVYDSHTQAQYAVTDINYNFDPVEISIPEVADVNYTFDPVEVIQSTVVQTSPNVKGLEANNTTIERRSIDATTQSDVDINIPQNTIQKNSNTFVVIIANEDYQRVSDVQYANNDGKLFAEYCQKTLGLPQNHVMVYNDATLGNMLGAVSRIKEIGEAYNGKVNAVLYYAGHGIPDETSKDAYLLPVDGDGSSVRTCYKQSELYSELASIKAESIVVFMDACFSGSLRGDGMLASARGVAIKAKKSNPVGNMVVFSAAQGDETAYPYKEQRHGMFTYYLLKKLQETKGEATLGEISDYVTSEVRKQSIVINGKMQTPTLTSSSAVGDAWRNWKLK